LVCLPPCLPGFCHFLLLVATAWFTAHCLLARLSSPPAAPLPDRLSPASHGFCCLPHLPHRCASPPGSAACYISRFCCTLCGFTRCRITYAVLHLRFNTRSARFCAFATRAVPLPRGPFRSATTALHRLHRRLVLRSACLCLPLACGSAWILPHRLCLSPFGLVSHVRFLPLLRCLPAPGAARPDCTPPRSAALCMLPVYHTAWFWTTLPRCTARHLHPPAQAVRDLPATCTFTCPGFTSACLDAASGFLPAATACLPVAWFLHCRHRRLPTFSAPRRLVHRALLPRMAMHHACMPLPFPHSCLPGFTVMPATTGFTAACVPAACLPHCLPFLLPAAHCLLRFCRSCCPHHLRFCWFMPLTCTPALPLPAATALPAVPAASPASPLPRCHRSSSAWVHLHRVCSHHLLPPGSCRSCCVTALVHSAFHTLPPFTCWSACCCWISVPAFLRTLHRPAPLHFCLSRTPSLHIFHHTFWILTLRAYHTAVTACLTACLPACLRSLRSAFTVWFVSAWLHRLYTCHHCTERSRLPFLPFYVLLRFAAPATACHSRFCAHRFFTTDWITCRSGYCRSDWMHTATGPACCLPPYHVPGYRYMDYLHCPPPVRCTPATFCRYRLPARVCHHLHLPPPARLTPPHHRTRTSRAHCSSRHRHWFCVHRSAFWPALRFTLPAAAATPHYLPPRAPARCTCLPATPAFLVHLFLVCSLLVLPRTAVLCRLGSAIPATTFCPWLYLPPRLPACLPAAFCGSRACLRTCRLLLRFSHLLPRTPATLDSAWVLAGSALLPALPALRVLPAACCLPPPTTTFHWITVLHYLSLPHRHWISSFILPRCSCSTREDIVVRAYRTRSTTCHHTLPHTFLHALLLVSLHPPTCLTGHLPLLPPAGLHTTAFAAVPHVVGSCREPMNIPAHLPALPLLPHLHTTWCHLRTHTPLPTSRTHHLHHTCTCRLHRYTFLATCLYLVHLTLLRTVAWVTTCHRGYLPFLCFCLPPVLPPGSGYTTAACRFCLVLPACLPATASPAGTCLPASPAVLHCVTACTPCWFCSCLRTHYLVPTHHPPPLPFSFIYLPAVSPPPRFALLVPACVGFSLHSGLLHCTVLDYHYYCADAIPPPLVHHLPRLTALPACHTALPCCTTACTLHLPPPFCASASWFTTAHLFSAAAPPLPRSVLPVCLLHILWILPATAAAAVTGFCTAPAATHWILPDFTHLLPATVMPALHWVTCLHLCHRTFLGPHSLRAPLRSCTVLLHVAHLGLDSAATPATCSAWVPARFHLPACLHTVTAAYLDYLQILVGSGFTAASFYRHHLHTPPAHLPGLPPASSTCVAWIPVFGSTGCHLQWFSAFACPSPAFCRSRCLHCLRTATAAWFRIYLRSHLPHLLPGYHGYCVTTTCPPAPAPAVTRLPADTCLPLPASVLVTTMDFTATFACRLRFLSLDSTTCYLHRTCLPRFLRSHHATWYVRY